ncbi:MAG: helix-turn-helix domain-containing protein [Rickettsiales bacterium]
MRVAIASRSTSVTRTLESLIEMAGHEVCATADAQLLIADGHHPTQLPQGLSILTIALGGANPDAISSPARIATVLQAITRAAKPPLTLSGGWALDPTARMLVHPEIASQTLTEKECTLLATLASTTGTMPREQLLAQVWGMAAQAETHTLETHIYRLRAKLNALHPLPCDLITEGGSYRLVLP